MASHEVLKEQLLEMGFDEKLINGALKLLKNNATLESVIEAIDNGTAQAAAQNPNEEESKEEGQDKVTEKTLAPEELEAKKKDYEEKLKQRRAEIAAQEKEKERLREIQRRKDGKDMGKLREELQQMQQQNYVENLKKEKAEAKAAKEKILRQIEQDKAERKAREMASNSAPSVLTTSKPLNLISSSTSATGKTKLAIRLLDGSQMVQEFDDKEVLSAVRAFIVTQKNIDFNITFAMSPRPPFSEQDMEKSLFMLGLSPNARLQVIKR